jgi:hypothetical protein
MITKVTLNLPDGGVVLFDVKSKSNENYVIDYSRSQESVLGVIVAVIAAMIIASNILQGINKARINKVLKQLEPYMNKIAAELHSIYIDYKKAIDLLIKSKYIEKIKEHYGKDITIKEDEEGLTITEENFVKIIMKKIASDIVYLRKNKKPLNSSHIAMPNLWYGGFDIIGVEDEPETYFDYMYEITKKLNKIISNKYKNIEYYFDMDWDDCAFRWWIIVIYNISHELLKEIMTALEK